MTIKTVRDVAVGDLILGAGQPVRVQSMTTVPTHCRHECLAQIQELIGHGCEIVRLAAATRDDTAALEWIVPQVSVPVVADVHFHFRRAIEAVEAGVAKIRLNPGNIQDRQEVVQVIDACKAHGTAIRVGVNEGSIIDRKDDPESRQNQRDNLVAVMLEKLTDYVRLFEERNFDSLVLSAKSHDPALCIAANRAIAERFDYPIHLGVTHAGDAATGTIRSVAAMAPLLCEGIGQTLRISLLGDPTVEVDAAWEMLAGLELRARRGVELIACPTCGRTEIDLPALFAEVKRATVTIKEPLKIAVMGCVVNGPGEAEGADLALCGGRDKAMIYCRGKKVATVPAQAAVAELLSHIKNLCK